MDDENQAAQATVETCPAPDFRTASAPAGLEEKLAALEEFFRSQGRVCVAASGGVDSSFLAAVCARAIPGSAALAHVDSVMVSSPERRSFEDVLARTGLPCLRMEEDSFADARFTENTIQRCYYCKHAGFSQMLEAARAWGADVMVDGANADDVHDWRPGMRATAELGVLSPLRDMGWTKEEERRCLRAWDFPVWDQPPTACLASRIPCGEPITPEKMRIVRSCEDWLLERGIRQVRVRLMDFRAVIEVAPEERAKLFDAHLLDEADAAFRAFGCRDVTMSLRGYRTGAMNHALDPLPSGEETPAQP